MKLPQPASFPLPTRPVVIAAAVFVLIYVALDLNKLYALRYGGDTGTFLQFLNNEAHGRGSWNGMEMRPHLQVHDSWVLLGLVPLVALFPYPQTILIAQVLAVAAAALAVCSFARACGADERGANAVSIAYLLSPSAQGLAYSNFIENIFVPLFVASGALFVQRRALVPSLICAQLLLGLKEDQALFLMWFGAACAFLWDRRIGIAVAILAAINGLGFVIAERLAHAAPAIPHYALQLDDPIGKLSFFAAVLAPFAFTSLLIGWRALLVAPLVAELTLNRPWAYNLTRIGSHWSAPFVIATTLAAAYVIAKRPRLATPVVVCSVLCALTINDTVLKIGRWPFIADPAGYAAARALGRSDAPVTFARTDEGMFAIAAANPHVVLAPYIPGAPGYCPGFNTNARAFFASIGIGAWPDGVGICGGAAVPLRRSTR